MASAEHLLQPCVWNQGNGTIAAFHMDQGRILCAPALLQASLSPNNSVLTHLPGPKFQDVALCDCCVNMSHQKDTVGMLWTDCSRKGRCTPATPRTGGTGIRYC